MLLPRRTTLFTPTETSRPVSRSKTAAPKGPPDSCMTFSRASESVRRILSSSLLYVRSQSTVASSQAGGSIVTEPLHFDASRGPPWPTPFLHGVLEPTANPSLGPCEAPSLRSAPRSARVSGAPPGPSSPRIQPQRPSLVIAPASVDPEVPWREALATKAETTYQRQRRAVARLDVGLQSMEPEGTERLPEREAETFSHVAAAGVWDKRVVPEVRALVVAAHELAEIDDTDELPGGAKRDEVAFVRDLAGALEVGAVGLRRTWRRHPSTVQPTAPADGGEELPLSPPRRFLELHPAPRLHII